MNLFIKHIHIASSGPRGNKSSCANNHSLSLSPRIWVLCKHQSLNNVQGRQRTCHSKKPVTHLVTPFSYAAADAALSDVKPLCEEKVFVHQPRTLTSIFRCT